METTIRGLVSSPLRRLVAVTLLVVLAVSPLSSGTTTNSNKPWHRTQQAFTGGLQEDGSATTAGGHEDVGDASSHLRFLTGEDKTDVWETDESLKLFQRILDGDTMGVMGDMLHNKDLVTLWSTPSDVHKMLQTFPMFRTLAGVSAIADKPESDITPSDGMKVLGVLRDFAAKAVEHVDTAAGQVGLNDLMKGYSDKLQAGGALNHLLDGMQTGDKAAHLEFHDTIFKDLWGDVLDKEGKDQQMGTPYSEPQMLAGLRDQLIKEDPDLYDYITNDDPAIKAIMEDLTLPATSSELLNAANYLQTQTK